MPIIFITNQTKLCLRNNKTRLKIHVCLSPIKFSLKREQKSSYLWITSYGNHRYKFYVFVNVTLLTSGAKRWRGAQTRFSHTTSRNYCMSRVPHAPLVSCPAVSGRRFSHHCTALHHSVYTFVSLRVTSNHL